MSFLPSRELLKASCSLGNCCQPYFCSILASTTSVQRATFLSRYFLQSFGWQWREYGRNREKHARLGKCLGEGQVECHFVGFPQGKNYSRGIGDAWHPSKTKVGSCHNHQAFLARIVNNQWKPNISPFPIHSHYGHRGLFGLQWKEYGRNSGTYARLEKLLGESQVECHFVGFPGEKLF